MTQQNPLAQSLNEKLASAASPILDMLSTYGQDIYLSLIHI